MSFEYFCPGCQRKLRFSADEESPRVRCPACNTLFEIPSQLKSVSPETSAGWYVRIPEGLTYGPVTQEVLDGWIAEGRIDAHCDLRREGQEIWQAAAPAQFPQPAKASNAALSPRSSSLGSPLPISPVTVPVSPRMSPSSPSGNGFRASQNGPIIFVLGLLSWLSCPVFGIAAWILGNRELERGSNWPDRQGDLTLVKAGRLLGMINVMLVLGGLFVAASMFALFVVARN
jgi:hypothetical protein